MKVAWCWRCKMDVPMLDEAEFSEVGGLYREAMYATDEFRKLYGIPTGDVPKALRFGPMLGRYEQITGFHEINPAAIMHHRLSLYGPPCARCGKLLRTPQAAKCFECGQPVVS